MLHRLLGCRLPHRGQIQISLVKEQDGMERLRWSLADPTTEGHEELRDPELDVLVGPQELGADNAEPSFAGRSVRAESEERVEFEWLSLGSQEVALIDSQSLQV